MEVYLSWTTRWTTGEAAVVRNITKSLLEKLEVGDYEIRDTKQSRLVLRVRCSGKHSYYVRLGRGSRRQWHLIGEARLLTPEQARDMAHEALADVARGKDPTVTRRTRKSATFGDFFEKQYRPWAESHLKSASSFLGRIDAQFSPLFGRKALPEITPFAVERWRTARLRGPDAVTPSTVNRDLVALKACLSKAVAWGVLPDHPLRGVRRSKEDDARVVRFLSIEEEKRLRKALAARDRSRREARQRGNDWRTERGYEVLSQFGRYTDHLTPLVLLAVNTGLRRGELLRLHWSDVDLAVGRLAVRGEKAKSGRTRHVPLNVEAVAVLKAWGERHDGLVFPSQDGSEMTTLKTAWLKLARTARLTNFRFHDLRHTFASKLVQRGVPLNTVRQLLGHSDFSLTLRYAHLAAEDLAAAVEKLA